MSPTHKPAHLPIDLIFSLPISFACRCTALFFLHKIVFATATTDNICSTRRCRFVNLRTCAYRPHSTPLVRGKQLRIDTSRTFHLSPFTSTFEELFTRQSSFKHLQTNNHSPSIRHQLGFDHLAPHSAIVH
jgi:hypothetical protein